MLPRAQGNRSRDGTPREELAVWHLRVGRPQSQEPEVPEDFTPAGPGFPCQPGPGNEAGSSATPTPGVIVEGSPV